MSGAVRAMRTLIRTATGTTNSLSGRKGALEHWRNHPFGIELARLAPKTDSAVTVELLVFCHSRKVRVQYAGSKPAILEVELAAPLRIEGSPMEADLRLSSRASIERYSLILGDLTGARQEKDPQTDGTTHILPQPFFG